jgi:TolB protein
VKKHLIAVLIMSFAVTALALAPVSTPARQGRIVAGTDKGADAIRFALPEFQPKNSDPNTIRLTGLFNQVLWDDLDYNGSIALVSRSFYPLGRFGAATDIRVDEWTKPGVNAQYMSFGNSEIRGGSLVLEAYIWDLGVVQERGPGFRLSSGDLSDDGVRLTAHRLADMIVDRLFGGRFGIAETKIAYVGTTATGSKEIFVMDYDGANAGALTGYRSRSLTPSWAPDGEKIAFTTYRQKSVVNIEILSRLDRRSYPFAAVGGTTTTPAWSPDGSQLAFSSSREGNMEIYIADWNGRNIRRLTVQKSIDLSPTWNPRNGRQIAFVSDRSGTQQIWIMDSDGTNLQQIITEGGDAENPSWSPDGQNIAFAWQKAGSGRFDIYIHDLARGRNTQLTSNAGDNERPSWAPDGKHLVFASTRTGTSQIYTMLANGEKVRQLTKSGRNEGPAWSTFLAK